MTDCEGSEELSGSVTDFSDLSSEVLFFGVERRRADGSGSDDESLVVVLVDVDWLATVGHEGRGSEELSVTTRVVSQRSFSSSSSCASFSSSSFEEKELESSTVDLGSKCDAAAARVPAKQLTFFK